MRLTLLTALVFGSGAACFDSAATPGEATTPGDATTPDEEASTVRVRVVQLASSGALGCFSVTGVSPEGEIWLDQGTTLFKGSRASAVDEGDFCESSTQPAQLVSECPVGPGHKLVLTLTGLFDAQGAAVETAFENPCPADSPCTLLFDCARGVETTVDFSLLIMRRSRQGFFDISAALPEEHRFGETCFVFRIVKGEAGGELVSATELLCSSEYGAEAGAITYVMPCDADAPENTLTVWLERTVFRSGVADPGYVNPCPVPADAGTSPVEAWTGGCDITAACLENRDTPIHYELDATRP